MMVSFVLSFFPRDVLDEILNLIESVSEDFPSYSYEQTSEKEKSVINNHIFHDATRFAVSVNEDQERLPTFYWLPKLHKNHIRLDLLLILAHARLPNYQNY